MLITSAPVDADVLRLRSEFTALPGLCLTTVQTARLLSIREQHARELLDSLVEEGFLIRTVSGVYRRPPPTC
jgi:predicted transcriptional regulator of viral defense system